MWMPLAPAPGSGRLQLDTRILPLLGGTKGEEKGSKQPSVCQSLTHPWARRLALGSRKRQALRREPGLRPAGRPGGQRQGAPDAPGPPSSSQGAIVPHRWPAGLAPGP